MIKARAHKETQQATAPGHDDYVEKEPNQSNLVPVGFLLFVMACMAFLKSCLPFSSSPPKEAAAEQKPQNSEPEQAALAVPPSETSKDVDAVPAEPVPTGSDDDVTTSSIETARKHGSNVIPIGPRFTLAPDELDNLLTRDSALDFRDSTRPPHTSVSDGSVGDLARPVNDNHRPGTSPNVEGGPSGGGGSGGGGGGGGGGDKPRGSDGDPPKPPVTSPPGGSDPPGGPGTPRGPDPIRNRAPRLDGAVHLRDLIGCQCVFHPDSGAAERRE